MSKESVATVVLLLACVPSTAAQDKSMYYTVVHADEFAINWKAFYDKAEEATAAVREELPHHLGLAYGEDPKQRLDLYLPQRRPQGAPVFLFFHGGGFREGDRAQYGYVARPFAENGIVTAVASYRLVPDYTYPDIPDDGRAAVLWLFENVASYGGDPNRIYVSGHSAGALITGTICAGTGWVEKMSIPGEALRGCAPISGSYDLRGQPGREDYLGDESRREEASPILNIHHPPARFVIAAGSEEERLLEPSRRFAEKLEEAGSKTRLVIEEGMDHAEIVWALGDGESKVFRAILEMMKP